MRKYVNNTNENRLLFFGGSKNEEIDDFTFIQWKNELQKELPSFWESMK